MMAIEASDALVRACTFIFQAATRISCILRWKALSTGQLVTRMASFSSSGVTSKGWNSQTTAA